MSQQTDVTPRGTWPASTSACGAMVGAPPTGYLLLPSSIPRSFLTEDWEQVVVPSPQTSSGGTHLEAANEAQSTSSAIMELRRLSGLTWEQLAALLGVARRSLHFWASGKRMNAPNEARLRRILAAIRRTDRGFAAKNRGMLLEERDGIVPFDLLACDEVDAFVDLVGTGPGRRAPKLVPLSAEAWEARKPQPPEELVGALQDRVHLETGKVRPARTVKIKR